MGIADIAGGENPLDAGFRRARLDLDIPFGVERQLFAEKLRIGVVADGQEESRDVDLPLRAVVPAQQGSRDARFVAQHLGGVVLEQHPVWYFCCFWLPGYLRSMGEAQGLSQQATLDMIQYIGGLPFLFGAVGGILTSVWSDWLVRRGMPALKARKTMMILMAFVAPLCILTPYVSEWQAVSFDARIGLVVAIFSLIAIMCLSWLYTICVVIAEAFPVKNVASVVGITAGAGAVGGAVFNIFIGSLLVTMGNVLFAVMGVMHLVTAVILWRMVRHETPKTVK